MSDTDAEVAVIREYIRQDGQLDLDDVKCLVVKRTGGQTTWVEGRDFDYNEMVLEASDVQHPVEMGAEDPLFILYTSGSTGRPKGAVLTQNALFWNAINSTHITGPMETAKEATNPTMATRINNELTLVAALRIPDS